MDSIVAVQRRTILLRLGERGVATPSRLISRELLLPIKLSIMRRREGGEKKGGKRKKTIIEKLIKPREIKLDGR